MMCVWILPGQISLFFGAVFFAQVLPDLHHGQRVWGAAPLRLSWDVGSDQCCTARAERKMPGRQLMQLAMGRELRAVEGCWLRVSGLLSFLFICVPAIDG